MAAAPCSTLDQHLRLRLADLPAKRFEDFFLHFLNAGVSLTIERHGSRLTRKVISATTYAGEGRDQKGIDIVARVEGGEEWCFQCKRQKNWTRSETLTAIKEAKRYQAHHYFLVVACDPPGEVHDEMRIHPDWTLWNLDRICAEFQQRVPPTAQASCLSFLHPAELKRFVPASTEALTSPQDFFERYLGSERLFRHDWKLVGREEELRSLDEFVRGDHPKVMLLVSKGGDGKSRLLWEFTRDIQTRIAGAHALFLNPQSRDDPAFAFLTEATKRVVVIDDAHRFEQIPSDLLSLVRKDPAAKLVLATRPQGVGALVQKLFEVGLQDDHRVLSLGRLNKAGTLALAVEALGEGHTQQAEALGEIASHCPFLIVLAGALLRRGGLNWGEWTSQAEFRGHVFRAFEDENLRDLDVNARELPRGLLRLIAMLAPLPQRQDFIEKASRCLDSSVLRVETQLQRLRAAELVSGDDDGLRIVPDLFADFLVYDTCYEPTSKLPSFARRVLSEFADRGPAALRNLAEAAWVAEANGLADDALIAPLVAAELRRFEEASFSDRATILGQWGTFRIYLPRESLALARRAIALDAAPRAARRLATDWGWDRRDSHEEVLEALPPLLGPLAVYDEEHRHEALDLLWGLGLKRDGQNFGGGQNHPFAVIAAVMRFDPNKPVDVTLAALRWLAGVIEAPDAMKALEGPAPILRTLLEPCFARFVEFQESERNTVHWWTRPVHLENTRPAREQALAIVRGVLERGSWLAALDALGALQIAADRFLPSEVQPAPDPAQLYAAWRPERLEALRLYEYALSRHVHVVVRFEARQTLRRVLAFEDDPLFASECHRVLGSIGEDLPLRVATAFSPDGFFELEGEATPPQEGHEQGRTAWPERLRAIALELTNTHAAPESLAAFLGGLAADFTQAGYHPRFGPLLEEVVRTNPALAVGLAESSLEGEVAASLAPHVPLLIDRNPSLTDAARFSLLAKAARSSIAGAAASAVGFLTRKAEQTDHAPTTEEADLLLELAGKPDGEAALNLLDFCGHAGECALPLVLRILEMLPISRLPPEVANAAWEVLVPSRKRATPLPESTVEHLLNQFVALPTLDLEQHWHQFHELAQSMPRTVYRFLHSRVLHAATTQGQKDYRPLPRGYAFALRLPGLRLETDYAAVCDELWERVRTPQEPRRYDWIRLWQAVVLEDRDAWLLRFLAEVEGAKSPQDLERLTEVLRFDGSLVALRLPEVARALLTRAERLGGTEALDHMRAALYGITGPAARHYSGGVLDKPYDYVEAEAVNAAERHASDPVLGPFYRWIVSNEQQDRAHHRAKNEAYLAALD